MRPPPLGVFGDPDSDPSLTPDDRAWLIAGLLARGLLRLRDRPDPPPLPAPGIPGDSSPNRLAFLPPDSLTMSGR